MCAAPALSCKNRLFVGEGNFSYTESLLEKHPDISTLASAITATELCPFEELSEETKERVERLRNLGVTVLFEVDATSLDRCFEGQRFKRIHWNHPWDGNDYNERTLPGIIDQFFASCRNIQHITDRVHISILRPPEEYRRQYQQGYILDIVRGTTKNGYKLIKKRPMINQDNPRYPNFKTKHNNYPREISTLSEDGSGSNEFVFEKRPDSDIPSEYSRMEAKNFVSSGEKNIEVTSRTIKGETVESYFCSTDDDSSSYYESDSENASEAKTDSSPTADTLELLSRGGSNEESE